MRKFNPESLNEHASLSFARAMLPLSLSAVAFPTPKDLAQNG